MFDLIQVLKKSEIIFGNSRQIHVRHCIFINLVHFLNIFYDTLDQNKFKRESVCRIFIIENNCNKLFYAIFFFFGFESGVTTVNEKDVLHLVILAH